MSSFQHEVTLSQEEVRGSAVSQPHTLTARETSERNFFHRSSAQTMREAGLVNDLAMTDVDSAVQIAEARHDEVRIQRRFLVTPHWGRRPARAGAILDTLEALI